MILVFRGVGEQMNIDKINDLLKSIVIFLWSNLTALLFLGGLSVVIYAFFKITTVLGYFSLGAGLILTALILAKEGR